MDLATLKQTLANDPVTAERCFVASSNGGDIRRITLWIKGVFGESNINCIEEMGNNLFVVTLEDASKRDDMLGSVSCIKYADYSIFIYCVLPLPGRVTVTVSGIPQLVITTYKQQFLQAVSEILPGWKKLDVLCVKGNPVIDLTAIVSDLENAKSSIPQSLSFKGYKGSLKYKCARPVVKGNFKPHINIPGLIYKGY